jgi:hypothetical protein
MTQSLIYVVAHTQELVDEARTRYYRTMSSCTVTV